MKLDEKQRTYLLATLAVIVVGAAIARAFHSSVPDEAAPATRADRGGVSAVASATAHDQVALEKLYRPIVEVEMFRAHTFLPKRGKGSGAGGAATVSSSSPLNAPPGSVSLRLTGIVVDDHGYLALLEDRSTGKGLFVHRGEKLGDREVAAIRTDALVLETVAALRTTSATIEFGDRVDLKLDDVTKMLVTLGPVASSASTSPGGPSSGAPALPALDTAKQQSILEQLRAKRRKSLGQN